MSKLNGVAKGKVIIIGWLFVKVAHEYKGMPQSFCLHMHAKCDLEQELKKILEIKNQGRVTHEEK